MKAIRRIACILLAIIALTGCDYTARRAWRILEHAEALRYSDPDSCLCIIDSLMRMKIHYGERFRMEMAMLQAETLFDSLGEPRDVRGCIVATLPDLEATAQYYADKGDLAIAAHAAMLYGYDQRHFGDPKVAAKTFKKATQYALMGNDSLTVAQAEYHLGDLLYYDGMEHEAIDALQKANILFGENLAEKARTLNKMGVCYILLPNYDSSEWCLNQGLACATTSHSEKTKQNILKNFAVLYRQKGEYDKAIEYLRFFATENNEPESDLLFNLNMGNVFLSMGLTDSAEYYLRRVEPMLTDTIIRKETLVAVYSSFSRLAETNGDYPQALSYMKQRNTVLAKVRDVLERKNVMRISHKYDYTTVQNKYDKELMVRHRIVIVAVIIVSALLALLTVFFYRMALMRKKGAEMKASLLLFMQQNSELTKSNEVERENNIKNAEKLFALMEKEILSMQKLDIYLKNKEDKSLLNDLNKFIFKTNDHWGEMMQLFDKLYPNLRKNISRPEFGLSENEQKSYILSFLHLSRQDEALLLNINIHSLDKIRSSVKEKLKNTNLGTPNR